ncbi:MAG: glycosyltransferase [Candidatus Taylorbacteria bacterium]|nr:glycosyltransferase [Candidatus Taylorbacteria bacterium]
MKILYLKQSKDTVNNVYIRGLEENGVEVLNLYSKPRRISDLIKLVRFYRRERANIDLIMVGFSSPHLAIFTRLISGKKIIYNATVSVYDRLILSRELASQFSIKAAYYLLLDFLAAHLADLTMVESNCQAEFFHKNFKVPQRKLYRAWIGVDENRFFYDPNIKKRDEFMVVFRGAFLPESGVEYAIKAAQVLEKENIKFIIIGGQNLPEVNKLIVELNPSNLELITDFMPQDKLNQLMQSSHISLGQLSDHPRLARTVPYKVFESLAMKLPYLTASNKGILELVKTGETCITCEPANAGSLAEKILWARNNPQELEKIALNGYKLYQNELRSHILAKNLLDRIQEL